MRRSSSTAAWSSAGTCASRRSPTCSTATATSRSPSPPPRPARDSRSSREGSPPRRAIGSAEVVFRRYGSRPTPLSRRSQPGPDTAAPRNLAGPRRRGCGGHGSHMIGQTPGGPEVAAPAPEVPRAAPAAGTAATDRLSAVDAVAVLSALGMAAGYARDSAVAAVFGASAVTDAFFVATIVPTAIAAVAISGTLAPALLPVFADSLRTPRDAWALADSVLTVAAGALLALSAAAAIAAPALVRWLAPGFDVQTLALATALAVLTAPMLALLGLGSVLGAVANAVGSFRIPALSALCVNGVAFVAILLAGARWGIRAAALGLVVGSLLHVIV